MEHTQVNMVTVGCGLYSTWVIHDRPEVVTLLIAEGGADFVPGPIAMAAGGEDGQLEVPGGDAGKSGGETHAYPSS